MVLKKFEELPWEFQNDAVLQYYEILNKKKASIVAKRIFDFVVALLALVILSPVIALVAILIKLDSPGRVIFRQERVTRYGKLYYIYKFRTMFEGSEKGSQVTLKHDRRITRIGATLRKFRLDEILQLINIIKGEMSFVGARPEVKKYVDCYSEEMYATLLLPAGVTSLASIKYKDEDSLLANAADADEAYVYEILPEKMKYNLAYLKSFGFFNDIFCMIKTVFAVCEKEKSDSKEYGAKEEISI